MRPIFEAGRHAAKVRALLWLSPAGAAAGVGAGEPAAGDLNGGSDGWR
ncbi:MAG: hypothetical protein AB1941_23090 [Gemmatimonadota bacterium]